MHHVLPHGLLPACVTFGHQLGDAPVLNHPFGNQQAPCANVHRANVANEHVVGFDRLAAHFGIKVDTTILEAARLHDEVQRQRGLGDVVGELVGVPQALHVATVHVDGTKDAQIDGGRNFMFKAVSCQCGVVVFDVDLDLFFETITAQEAIDRGYVVIVLVLGGFARFGFDQDAALEADFVFVFHHHVHKAAHLVQLLANARVQQGFVALTATP